MCIVVLKVTIWSKGSRVPSYESKEGILNFGGKGWPLMEVVKKESVWWTKSSMGFALLMFSLISSMTFLIWSISFSKCGTLCEVVPFDWLSGSTFPPLFSWLWVCPSTYPSCRCLLRLNSIDNSWFWRVNSTMVAAMDCMCWMEDGCMTGADWWTRWGLLEASLLSWWSGLVALDLVQTMQPFCRRKINCKNKISSYRWRQLMMLRKSVGWMFRTSMISKAWKRKTKIQRRPGLAGHKSSNDKVSFSLQNLKLRISRNCVKEKPAFICREIGVYIVLWKQLFV